MAAPGSFGSWSPAPRRPALHLLHLRWARGGCRQRGMNVGWAWPPGAGRPCHRLPLCSPIRPACSPCLAPQGMVDFYGNYFPQRHIAYGTMFGAPLMDDGGPGNGAERGAGVGGGGQGAWQGDPSVMKRRGRRPRRPWPALWAAGSFATEQYHAYWRG